jgi:haloacetate dehalogenase
LFEGFAERRVTLSEAELFLRLGGEGPPLLLLHGYPQTHVAWHRVAPRLMRKFTLIMPDLRGYGASRGPKPDPQHRNYAKRAMARDMAELMTALGHERFLVAGHDRGARVGFRLALDAPERVQRFAALDIIPTLDVWEQMDADKALAGYHWQFLAVPAPVPEHLIGADPAFYVTHLLARWAGRRDALDPESVAAYVGQFHDPAVIAATCEDYRAGASIDRVHDAEDRRHGRKIGCPVLVLWGRGYLTSKAASPIAVWRRWADDVRDIAFDCGHFVVEEVPEACAAALIDFFDAEPAHG